jgi:hypothetical protein
MMLHPAGHDRHLPDLVSASLLTAGGHGEVHLVARDGRLLRLATDEATARNLALSLWKALHPPG